ncbi:MAG: hypothetical protein GTO43_07915, partial [Armatimonadetes bacterium]|nr:hypothetical protein [Armatimonadota bacterium]
IRPKTVKRDDFGAYALAPTVKRIGRMPHDPRYRLVQRLPTRFPSARRINGSAFHAFLHDQYPIDRKVIVCRAGILPLDGEPKVISPLPQHPPPMHDRKDPRLRRE